MEKCARDKVMGNFSLRQMFSAKSRRFAWMINMSTAHDKHIFKRQYKLSLNGILFGKNTDGDKSKK